MQGMARRMASSTVCCVKAEAMFAAADAEAQSNGMSHNPEADDEILIWLNGGPGCSSLEGFLQENGPFIWQYGTYRPVQNPYTWINLTNVVWIEQPAGTGYSPQKSTPPATNEVEVAAQFLGFWKNFIDTFELHNRKVYIAGESYAGYYVPYIADAMHNETDKQYYGIESVLFYDPVITYNSVGGAIPSVPFVEYWEPLFSFNDTFMDHLREKHEDCGYADFMETALTFPPAGPLPDPPSHSEPGCNLFVQIYNAAMLVNPCWDIYQVATTCPLLWVSMKCYCFAGGQTNVWTMTGRDGLPRLVRLRTCALDLLQSHGR